ncbi:MAG: ABC transporter permease [Herbiconiux sp.]|uniref:ABC transporter permease n=1 Tax=Herbiconiux sp. TaxID=1871186 RepID=UPI00121F9656|nr:ABC transporter permease [Herbiconiux sp.]TAJ50284.1 MAG: ABC transporter permease [Herbiconiux sp.]
MTDLDTRLKTSPAESTKPGRPTLGAAVLTVLKHPATPAFIGMIAIWLAIGIIAGRGLVETISAGIIIATFLVIVGIGQLFVITVGNGGIDLSVSYVMTLSAFLACQIMAGENSNIVAGILVAVVAGLAAGAVSAVLIEFVGMPPLVGTLAVGFGLQTITLVYSGSVVGVAAPALSQFTTAQIGPIPIFGIVGVVIAVAFAIILKRTSYGRRVEAVGQKPVAASFANARPALIRASAYVLSGGMAGLAGVLLAAYSGGPSLGLGSSYQLASIAVVVLGGSLIAGGRGIISGLWAGAVLLTLLTTLANITRLSGGWQFIIQGALIVIVLALARNPMARR